MNSNHPAEQKTQAHGPRSLSFAIAPIAFGATALWIAIQALSGGNPVAGFGNVATIGLITMVVIGWGCHFLASRQQMAAGTMPRPL